MGYKSSSLLCLALVLAVSSAVQAFDITKMLAQYPEYSSFSKYITETKLADQINSRNTITVLVVENGALSGAVSGKSPDAIKAVISTHIVLDYFDEKKLMEALGSSQQLTTLYQASGLAVNQQGFLKVALVGEGEIAFGSAVTGAPVDAELVKTVTSEPYNISIIQVSKPIVFPGADKASSGQQGAKTPVSAPVPTKGAKAPAQSAKAPVAAGAKAPAPSDEVVATPPAGDIPADTPADAPEASSTAPASGPAAADAKAPAPSASSTTKFGLVGAMMAFASLLVVL